MSATDEPLTLRLMIEQDLPMLHEWLNRAYVVEWRGGARPTLAEVQEDDRPSAMAHLEQLGKGLGTRLARALVELLFADPMVTRIQTDPAPNNVRAIRCHEKAGFVQERLITTPDGPAVYMVHGRQAFERERRTA